MDAVKTVLLCKLGWLGKKRVLNYKFLFQQCALLRFLLRTIQIQENRAYKL